MLRSWAAARCRSLGPVRRPGGRAGRFTLACQENACGIGGARRCLLGERRRLRRAEFPHRERGWHAGGFCFLGGVGVCKTSVASVSATGLALVLHERF